MMDKNKVTFLWQRANHWLTLLTVPVLVGMMVILMGQIDRLAEVKGSVRPVIICVNENGKVSLCDEDHVSGDEEPLRRYITQGSEQIIYSLLANRKDVRAVKSETAKLIGHFRSHSSGGRTFIKEARKAVKRAETAGSQFDVKEAQIIYVKAHRAWVTKYQGVLVENIPGEHNRGQNVTVEIVWQAANAQEERDDPRRIMRVTQMRVNYEKG